MGKKKKSLAESRREKSEKYFARRKQFPRMDMEYPATPEEMDARLCQDEKSVDRAVAYHLEKAEEEKGRSGAYWLVLDTEGYLVDAENAPRNTPYSWSWHEQTLKREGVRPPELGNRAKEQETLQKEWSRLSQAEKAVEFFARKQEMEKRGIVRGNVMGISVSAVDDELGKHSFLIHTKNLIEREYGGFAQLPLSFEQLLLHPNVRLINVAIHGDIEDLFGSFYFRRPAFPVKFVEAVDFFRRVWGEAADWTAGYIDIIERANPGKTIFKPPGITLSFFGRLILMRAQIKYMFNDTYFLAKAVKEVLDEGIEFDIFDIMNVFPAPAMAARNQQSFYALLNIAPTDTSIMTQEPASTSEFVDIDDLEPPVEIPLEIRLPAGYEDRPAEKLPEPMESDVEVEARETDDEEDRTVAFVTCDTRRVELAEIVGDGQTDNHIDLLTAGNCSSVPSGQLPALGIVPESGRNLPLSATMDLSVSRPRTDEYAAIDVVEDVEAFDREAPDMDGRQATVVRPYITHFTMHEIQFTRTVSCPNLFKDTTPPPPPPPLPHVSASRALPAISAPALKDAEVGMSTLTTTSNIRWTPQEPVITHILTRKQKLAVHYRTKYFLNDSRTGKQKDMLLQVADDSQPEFFARVFTGVGRLNHPRKEVIRSLLADVAPLWSLPEKRRFLAQIAERADIWEFGIWADTVGICEFDPIFFAARCTGPLLNIAGSVPIERVREVTGQVAKLLMTAPEERLGMIRASRYSTESLEAVALEKCSDQNLEINIKAICLNFVLPFPTPLRVQNAASVTRQWIVGLEKGKISEKDFITLIDCLVKGDKGAEETVKIVVKQNRRAVALVKFVFDQKRPSPGGPFPELPCWTKTSKLHQDRAREWDVVEVGEAWGEVEDLLKEETTLAVAYRLMNDVSYAPRFAAFMFSRPDSEKKYLWRCLVDADADRRRCCKKLSSVHWQCVNPGEFKLVFKNAFGGKCVAGTPFPVRMREGINKICKKIDLVYCEAGKMSPLLVNGHVNASVIFHLAAELEIVRHGV